MKGYRTNDFYLSVYLQTQGHIADVEYPENSNRAFFTFVEIDKDEVERLTQQFYQDDILQDFIVNIRGMKDKLYMNRPPKKN